MVLTRQAARVAISAILIVLNIKYVIIFSKLCIKWFHYRFPFLSYLQYLAYLYMKIFPDLHIPNCIYKSCFHREDKSKT